MILHIQPSQNFCLRLKEKKPKLKLKLDVSFIGSTYEHYEGAYVISPKVTPQLMETKDKVMDDDVSIKEIYFNETENDYGYTVQIGEI